MAEPAPVYDPDDEKPVTQPDLYALEGGAETTDPEHGHLKIAGSENSNKALSPDGIREAEESAKPAEGGEAKDEEAGRSFGYREESASRLQRLNPFGKKSKLSSRKKKIALMGGLGGGAVIVIIVLIILSLFSSLKIMHVAENITVYNMARTARSFADSASDITADNIAADELDQSGFQALKSKFGAPFSDALSKFDNWRPNKVFENLKNDGKFKLVYEEGEPRSFGLQGNKQIFKGVQVGDNFVDAADTKWFPHPNNFLEPIRYASDLKSALESNLDGPNGIVRWGVLKKALAEQGIKLSFWQKLGVLYKGLSQNAAARKATLDLFEKVKASDTEGCGVTKVCTAAESTNKAAEEQLKKDVADENSKLTSEQAVKNAEDVADAEATKATTSSIFGDVVQAGSIINTVALPACLIYDGSVVHSKSSVDNKQKSLERTYFAFRSAADQQKAGDTTLPAVGGLADKMGQIDDSNPMRRARGEVVDTTAETSKLVQPQAGNNGTFSLFTLLFGSSGKAVQDFADNVCPKITNPLAQGVIMVTEQAINIALAAASAGATVPADAGVEASAEVVTKGFVTIALEQITKSSLADAAKLGPAALAKYVTASSGKLLGKIALQTGAIVGSSLYLKMQVIQHSNLTNSGLATDAPLVNQADMGGNLYANNEANRKMFYGRPMTGPEVTISRAADAVAINQKNSAQSFSQRYFAISNPNSLLGRMGITISSITDRPLKSFSSFFAALKPQTLISAFSSLTPFRKQVLAASQSSGAGDYNIVQWGWTEQESSIINSDATLKPVLNEAVLKQSGKESDIANHYNDCFTKTIGELQASGEILRNDDGSLKDGPEEPSKQNLCSPQNLGPDNNDFGDKMVFRWRLANRNNNVLDYLKGIEASGSPSQSANGK